MTIRAGQRRDRNRTGELRYVRTVRHYGLLASAVGLRRWGIDSTNTPSHAHVAVRPCCGPAAIRPPFTPPSPPPAARGEHLDGRAAARAVLAEAARAGAAVGAFFAESVLSCGGQVVYPPGYLQVGPGACRGRGPRGGVRGSRGWGGWGPNGVPGRVPEGRAGGLGLERCQRAMGALYRTHGVGAGGRDGGGLEQGGGHRLPAWEGGLSTPCSGTLPLGWAGDTYRTTVVGAGAGGYHGGTVPRHPIPPCALAGLPRAHAFCFFVSENTCGGQYHLRSRYGACLWCEGIRGRP